MFSVSNSDHLISRKWLRIQQQYYVYQRPHVQRLMPFLLELESVENVRMVEGYNLALGRRAADEVRDFLISLGVPEHAIETVSFGEEHPQCTQNMSGGCQV